MADTTSSQGNNIHVQGVAMETVSQTKTILATTDYTANDVVSDSSIWTFTIPRFAPGGSGEIKKALLSNQNTQAAHSCRMYFYNSTSITAVLTDNAANTGPTSADVLAGYALGWIDFPAFTNKNATPTQALVTPGQGNCPLPFKCAEGSSTIYGILITLDAFTNEVANASYVCALDIRKD